MLGTDDGPPVAMAANILMIKIFNESARETAEIAVEPILVIMMVSTDLINAFKTCSNINGIKSLLNCSLVYMVKLLKIKRYLSISLRSTMTILYRDS